MDFFEHQDQARKRTRWLVVIFVLSMIAIAVSIHLTMSIVFALAAQSDEKHEVEPWFWFTSPVAIVGTLAGTALIVGGGTAYKVSALQGGGSVVAEMLGGRLVHRGTRDLVERRLLNIVDEMALAAGVPVPPVYLLDEEGINAFAAGYTPGDAVVAVTRGCVQRLTRDELQGVVAHEFSHILNGDMRLNIRLMGVVYGLLVLAYVGELCFRFAPMFGRGSSRDSKNSGAGLALLLFIGGLVLMALGFLGMLIGNLIKAAISRQREFLADASAVQFTRNPDGIAGALKKIGGFSRGSRIQHAHASEASHMYFSKGVSEWFATHPPLQERIERIQPNWDGRIPDVDHMPPPQLSDGQSRAGEVSGFAGESGPIPGVAAIPDRRAAAQSAAVGGAIAGLSALSGSAAAAGGSPGSRENAAHPPSSQIRRLDHLPPLPPVKSRVAMPGNILEAAGQLDEQHFATASKLMLSFPPVLDEAMRDPHGAASAIFALFIDDRPEVREAQWRALSKDLDAGSLAETQHLYPYVAELPAEYRLPLVDLAIPSLRQMSAEQFRAFFLQVDHLIKADGRLHIREWVLHKVLMHHLQPNFRPSRTKSSTSQSFEEAASIVLSLLSRVGHDDAEEITAAFRRGAKHIGVGRQEPLPIIECGPGKLDLALDRLAGFPANIRRSFVGAAAACVTADGHVTIEESEILRCVGDLLGVPLPPLGEITPASVGG